VRRAQLVDLGLEPGAIASRLAAERMRAVHRGVYRIDRAAPGPGDGGGPVVRRRGGPESPRRRLPLAAASGSSPVQGSRGQRPRPRPGRRPGVRVHRVARALAAGA
jgi:hypothetical protein